MKCKYAELTQHTSIPDGIGSPRIKAHLAEHGISVGLTAIKDHRAGTCRCTRNKPAHEAQPEQLTGQAIETSDGVEFVDVQVPEKIATDWSHVFARFGLDPTEFEIVDDTVRISTWQQSKGLDDGTRDIVNLYSYRARFRRKQHHVEPARLDDLIKSLRSFKPARPTRLTRNGPAHSLVVGLADWQLGKNEGGQGTPQTLERLRASLENVLAFIDDARTRGLNLSHLVLANLGDHTENVAGSYASQTHSVDLNMRDQLTLAIEENVRWLKTLVPLFDTATYAACLCNHGQLSRGQGRDNVTDDSDNATGFIGDTLRTVCNLHPDLSGIDWVIPRDEMLTTYTASGVNIASAHGHKISGKEEQWLAAQSQYLTHTRGFIPDLWFTAHRHSAAVNDYGPYTRIQATTVDPGSKWFTDNTGMYATPGTTVFLAGSHLPMKWTDYRIL